MCARLCERVLRETIISTCPLLALLLLLSIHYFVCVCDKRAFIVIILLQIHRLLCAHINSESIWSNLNRNKYEYVSHANVATECMLSNPFSYFMNVNIHCRIQLNSTECDLKLWFISIDRITGTITIKSALLFDCCLWFFFCYLVCKWQIEPVTHVG